MQTLSYFMLFPAVIMMVSLVEYVLLVKLLFENKGNASAVVCEFCHIKNDMDQCLLKNRDHD